MKRKLAWAWLVLCGLAMLLILVAIPFQPWSWASVHGGAVVSALASPAIRYLRRKPREISGPE
jgi:hypothetical protein